jgi:5-methylcytosine-specific restriction endonuclease McrA
MNQSKLCRGCQTTKPLTDFSPAKGVKDGRYSRCRDCKCAAMKTKYDANPEYRERLSQKNKARYSANAEKMIRQVIEYNRLHPEVKLASSHRNEVSRKYGTRVYEVTAKDIKRLLASPCIYCGSTNKITIDHVIPRKRGGVHSVGNIVPACQTCNASRKSDTIMEWRVKKNKLNARKGI